MQKDGQQVLPVLVETLVWAEVSRPEPVLQAQLRQAQLRQAQLRRAQLRRAQLRQVRSHRAWLRLARLRQVLWPARQRVPRAQCRCCCFRSWSLG
ncbi:pentapeptide repeat-containing protein [Tabrizicola sp. BL-A-41-H6]|uniref:pentapeptide repeat-containing protein n=1 Tax=Tabrizicola sp. BL-A-41-H6 TaxID=3421107 RepID=UPI003D66C2F7